MERHKKRKKERGERKREREGTKQRGVCNCVCITASLWKKQLRKTANAHLLTYEKGVAGCHG